MNFKIFCDMAEFMVQLLVYENASKFEKIFYRVQF